MNRPNSIVQFERLYLGAVLLGLANTALAWDKALELLAANPQTAAFGPGFLAASTAVGVIINLLLWYFVARKGSTVAKWIVVVFCAFGVLGVIWTAVTGQLPEGIAGILGIVRVLLNLGAVVFLFRPDTKAWFGEPVAE